MIFFETKEPHVSKRVFSASPKLCAAFKMAKIEALTAFDAQVHKNFNVDL
jgi:hypothetical protein